MPVLIPFASTRAAGHTGRLVKQLHAGMKIKTNMNGNFTRPGQFKASFVGLTRLPFGRQFGLAFGFAVCLSVAFFLVHWIWLDKSATPANATTSQVSRNTMSTAVSGQQRPGYETSENGSRIWKAGQWMFGGILAVLLLLGVFRPLMRDLANLPSARGSGTDTPDERFPENSLMQHGAEAGKYSGSEEYEKFLATVRNLARDDPKRVAQLLKGWLNENSSR